MKKLLAAALLALGAAHAADASQFVRPWYEGQHFCKFNNASGYFNVRFTSKVVERPHTCKNGRCQTNGYEQKTSASIYLNLWNRPYDADSVSVAKEYLYLHKMFAEGRLTVRLEKPRHASGNIYGFYTDAKGQRFGLVCRRS